MVNVNRSEKRGLVGVAALWLILAVSSLALATLEIAKWEESSGRNRIHELKEIYLVQMASLMEAETNFSEGHVLREFTTGRVVNDRTFVRGQNAVMLLSQASCGPHEKKIETGWDRVGDRWHATYWREW